MRERNPFTAITNLSFVRNANHLSGGRPASRSYSGHKKFFDYQGSYLRDAYLQDWEVRRNQAVLSSRVMGVDSLRYAPPTVTESIALPLQSTGEYYNLQTFSNAPESLPLRSEQQSTLKCSTKDMFGSQYFKNRFGTQQDEKMDSYQILMGKTPSIVAKGAQNSRFKKTQERKVSMPEEELEQSVQATDLGAKQPQLTCESDEPQTIFLKSRGKHFFLYRNPNQEDY